MHTEQLTRGISMLCDLSMYYYRARAEGIIQTYNIYDRRRSRKDQPGHICMYETHVFDLIQHVIAIKSRSNLTCHMHAQHIFIFSQ